MRRRRTSATTVLLIALSGGTAAAERSAPASPHEAAATLTRARYLMGSTLTVTLPGVADPSVAIELFEEVSRLERLMSNWDPNSELSRLNRAAGQSPVVCSVDLFAAITAALRWSEDTSGAFDPTVEPLVRRSRAGSIALPAAPVEVAGDERGKGAPIGRRYLRLDADRRSVRFGIEGVGIDLGGIGKGIALDAAARILRRGGVEDYLLDFGGQILARGGPAPGEPWRIGVADPADRHAAIGRIALRSGSIATSGRPDRAGPDEVADHILDPRSGRPAAFVGSVTVFDAEATSADALSTALFVMGPEAGIPWAAEREIGALFVDRDREGRLRLRATKAFPEWIAGGSRVAEGTTETVESRAGEAIPAIN